MMPPGVAGPGIKQKVKKTVEEEGDKQKIQRIVETEQKNPFHALDTLESGLGLKARSEDYKPKYRAKEKVSGDGDDDDDEGEGKDDEKPI